MPISIRRWSSRSRNGFPRRAAALALGLALLAGARPGAGADSAVVVLYDRFGGSPAPQADIRLDQFESHLAAAARDGVNVMSIPEIVEAIRAGRDLPDRTIGISIDGARLPVHAEAWPRLRAAGLPFTLFVATDPVDAGAPDHMSWDQIRELAQGGAAIGAQTASAMHMPGADAAFVRESIARARRSLEREIGRAPTLFAYPYGEMSLAVRAAVIEQGFAAAFGRHSGVLYAGEDFHFLPRFAMTGSFGDVDRFRLAASALALRVKDVLPTDRLLEEADNPPVYGFTVVGEAVWRIDALACYASALGRARIEKLGAARVEIRLPAPFPRGQGRINCTLPEGDGRWRWYGTQFYVPGR